MGQRRKARESVLRILYSLEQSGRKLTEDAAEGAAAEIKGLEKNGGQFAEKLLLLTLRNVEKADRLIQECSLNWDIARIIPTDRNIMRIAVTELAEGTAPAPVVINEAIEISKKYGTSDSGSFVNGILDCVRKKLEHPDV